MSAAPTPLMQSQRGDANEVRALLKDDAAMTEVSPRRNYGRWRAFSLIAVYLLMAAHVVHWKLNGRTLAPLELNEVLYTLELGIVTAGFIFMSLAVLATAIFGRFFCSWGCHILALQDLCAWLLGRVGIRPKPVRSRVMLLVPVAAMVYMFIWPHVISAIEARPRPAFHIAGDAQGWASFVTADFWRNLPGPWMTALTFAVCGFAIVYMLGSRAFCTYACPYGAIFALADRIAPGKIKARGDRSECAECGLCTAACTSHIRVHEELTVFGRVVSPACMKDLDCVSVCPNGAIAYGFTKPSGFKSWRRWGRFGVPYDYSIIEDVLMIVVFLGALAVFRGLYDRVPFLLALAIAVILAWASVLGMRLFSRANVRVNNFQLRRDRQWTRAGWGALVLLSATAAFTAHSGFVRWREAAGLRAFNNLAHAAADGSDLVGSPELLDAIEHHEWCARWGLVLPPQATVRLASMHLWNQQPERAEPHLRRWLDLQPDAHDWRLTLAAILLMQNRADEAIVHLRMVISRANDPEHPAPAGLVAAAHEMIGDIARALDQLNWAATEYRAAMAADPNALGAVAKLELLPSP